MWHDVAHSLWWSKNYEVEFFELKINFSIYLQLKTPNTTIKSLPKTSTKLKIPQNHPKKSKSIEPQRLKRNSIFFFMHVCRENSLPLNSHYWMELIDNKLDNFCCWNRDNQLFSLFFVIFQQLSLFFF